MACNRCAFAGRAGVMLGVHAIPILKPPLTSASPWWHEPQRGCAERAPTTVAPSSNVSADSRALVGLLPLSSRAATTLHHSPSNHCAPAAEGTDPSLPTSRTTIATDKPRSVPLALYRPPGLRFPHSPIGAISPRRVARSPCLDSCAPLRSNRRLTARPISVTLCCIGWPPRFSVSVLATDLSSNAARVPYFDRYFCSANLDLTSGELLVSA